MNNSAFLCLFNWIILFSIFFCSFTILAESGSYGKGDKLLVLLIPSKEAVISARVDANIAKYVIGDNHKVKQGQLVVSLDKESFKLQEKIYTARLAEIKLKKAHHDREHDRYLNLFKQKVVSAILYESERLKKDQFYERLENVTSALNIVKLDLKYCDVRAPFKGRIVKKIAKDHEFIEVGDPIFKIIRDNPLHVIVDFSSKDIHKVKCGQFLNIKLNDINQDRLVKIISISAEINPESETFQVKGEINNDDYLLRPGMFGTCFGVIRQTK